MGRNGEENRIHLLGVVIDALMDVGIVEGVDLAIERAREGNLRLGQCH